MVMACRMIGPEAWSDLGAVGRGMPHSAVAGGLWPCPRPAGAAPITTAPLADGDLRLVIAAARPAPVSSLPQHRPPRRPEFVVWH